jgi:hypothetical protein
MLVTDVAGDDELFGKCEDLHPTQRPGHEPQPAVQVGCERKEGRVRFCMGAEVKGHMKGVQGSIIRLGCKNGRCPLMSRGNYHPRTRGGGE